MDAESSDAAGFRCHIEFQILLQMFLLSVGHDAVRQRLDELTRQRCLADRMQLALDLDLCGRVGGEEQIGAVLFNAELEVRQDFQHAISSVSTTQHLMTVAASS